MNPYTHKLWALVNNDGLNGTPPRQPALYVIDPTSLQSKLYAFSTKTQPHGGGYDDLAFVNGHVFLSASSPTLTAAGINDKPVAVEAQLQGTTVVIHPILYGNAVGFDISAGKAQQLNITDPDSLTVDTQNELIVVSEGDAQLVAIRNPGAANQSVARLALGTQTDEIAWTRGTTGTLFAADTSLNRIYSIRTTFPRGSVFAEAPLGAPTSSFIGTVDVKTGVLTPLLTVRDGILNPATLNFVVSGEEEDDS